METTVTPIQSTVVSGGPQARGNATMIKLESKVIRNIEKGEGGRGRKLPCGLQGRAQPGRASAMEAEGGSQNMGCQGRRSGHITETLDVFNKLWTSRWQSVWSL